MKRYCMLSIVIASLLAQAAVCHAVTYVTPKIGGDQVGMMGAPMIMPEIYFDGNDLLVVNASWQPWPVLDWDHAPVLRPLSNPNQAFDPCQPYAVLTGNAYNFQYGWDSGLLDTTTYPFPAGSVVWVKVLSQTAGLKTYYKDGGYAPLFGTPEPNGSPSSDKWIWNMGMRHNVYAVPTTYYGRIYATYQVYIGEANGFESIDDHTGMPFGSSIVTFRWTRPCPYVLTGDLSLDCRVDFSDMALLAAQWSAATCATPDWCDNADVTRSTTVDYGDMGELMANWLMDCFATPSDPLCVPR